MVTYHSQSMKKEIMIQPSFFYSSKYGGCLKKGYSEIISPEDLNLVLNQQNQLKLREQGKKEITKGSKLIYYCFGEFSSASYQPNGIDRIVLNGENLEIYITQPTFSQNERIYVEQVKTNPWMLFSIPKKLEYKNIVVK